MNDFEYTKHAQDMLSEREIQENWLIETLENPERTEFINNEELHFIKKITNFGNRYFRVVVNPYTQPKKIITFFFDRRIKD